MVLKTCRMVWFRPHLRLLRQWIANHKTDTRWVYGHDTFVGYNSARGFNKVSSEIIFEIVESPEGGYEGRALGYPIFTQADTPDELKQMLRDAVQCHFGNEADRPRLIRLHCVRDELISA